MQKPQDVSDPAVQDVSGDMDLLAVLLATSNIPSRHHFQEASDLTWYGKRALQDPLLDRPYNERRSSGLEPSDPRYEVKVLKKTLGSQILEPFELSNGHVVALVHGQALNCGIGPAEWFGIEIPITYLSAKDVLRWTKISEWIEQQFPRHEVAVSQSEDPTPGDTLSWKLLNDPSGARVPPYSLSVHVSDFQGTDEVSLDRDLWFDAIHFVVETKVFLTLLVALPLVYGGIHLTTWNFDFASHVEQMLWKIACIDIMGTIPLGVAIFACISPIQNYQYKLTSIEGLPYKATGTALLALIVCWIFLAPMFIFYTLSRIYIVVESFISLRHVPIGVYAAIPWVQDIPHI